MSRALQKVLHPDSRTGVTGHALGRVGQAIDGHNNGSAGDPSVVRVDDVACVHGVATKSATRIRPLAIGFGSLSFRR